MITFALSAICVASLVMIMAASSNRKKKSNRDKSKKDDSIDDKVEGVEGEKAAGKNDRSKKYKGKAKYKNGKDDKTAGRKKSKVGDGNVVYGKTDEERRQEKPLYKPGDFAERAAKSVKAAKEAHRPYLEPAVIEF